MLTQDTPLEATEFGKNLWQQGSKPQLHFWLAKFTANKGRNAVLSKLPKGNLYQSSAKMTATRQVSFSLWDVKQGLGTD